MRIKYQLLILTVTACVKLYLLYVSVTVEEQFEL